LRACFCFVILEGIAVGHSVCGDARRDLWRR
jgi:hypothetical protein